MDRAATRAPFQKQVAERVNRMVAANRAVIEASNSDPTSLTQFGGTCHLASYARIDESSKDCESSC